MEPGAPALDAPLRGDGRDGWLLRQLVGGAFTALVFDGEHAAAVAQALRQAAEGLVSMQVLLIAASEGARLPGARTLVDGAGLIRRRYDGAPGTAYLLRPDQHVCARWRHASRDAVRRALQRALALH